MENQIHSIIWLVGLILFWVTGCSLLFKRKTSPSPPQLKFYYREEAPNHWYASCYYKSGYFMEIGDTKEEARTKLTAEMKKILGPSESEVVTL